MTFTESAYTILLRTALPVAHAVSRAGPLLRRVAGHKTYRGLEGMLGAGGRLEEWGAQKRDSSRPLVWFHAPSVGEGLQARAVIHSLRRMRSDVQIVYTYFSPSAIPFADGIGADYSDFLPVDTPRGMGGVLDSLMPEAIVFSKNEVWPNLTRESDARGIPVLLLSATLPSGASRTRGLAADLLRKAHERLTHVGAISPEDAGRYRDFGVRPERVFVMGDARFDQVRARMERLDRYSPLLRILQQDGTPTLVAGSTWPPDEDVLLGTLATLREEGVRLRVIAAPHEPTPEALRSVEERASRRNLRTVRLAELLQREDGRDPATGTATGTEAIAAVRPDGKAAEVSADIILVDRVGVLGDLYAVGHMAYVGGGFGSAGLHSVLEPAAFGIPVAFGPNHSNAREAAVLVQRGAGVSVDGPQQMLATLRNWATDHDTRRRAGELAAGYVEENVGAADRGARAVCDAIDG